MIPPNVCPACGNNLDASETLVDPETVPNPGDISMCIYCFDVARFDSDMRLHSLGVEDIERLNIETLKELHGLYRAFIPAQRD